MRALDGITVVSLEQAVAAPICTRHLADLGARVIKIERPDAGDFARGYDTRANGLSSYFVWANRSKESLGLDVKHDEARTILAQLLETADVFVQNLAPGAADRLGLSYETLSRKHPRLIVCDISGYGADGPYRDKKAYDLLIQSEAGFLSVTGTPDAPAKAGASIADISAGMYAYSGILAALIARGKTGKGAHVPVSMLECMSEWMSQPLYYAFTGDPPERHGAAHASIVPYGPYPAGDGGIVMLGLQNEREWAIFCDKVLGDAALAHDPRFASNALRTANREAVRELIVARFAAMTADDAIALLDAARIANAKMNDMKSLREHPQLKARNRWVEIEAETGPIPALLPPGVPAGAPPRMDPVPALGQHTDAILEGLGFDAAAIAVLRKAGAVG